MDGDDSDPYEDDSFSGDDRSSDSSFDEDDYWLAKVLRVKENDPEKTMLAESGDDNYIRNITDDGWEELGRDISNNTHLETVALCSGALDDQKLSCFFRGLTESSSIKNMHLYDNGLSVAAVRSMVPFLQNANSLNKLTVSHNNLQSGGLNLLFRALRDSPIETLSCNNCGIESIDIDIDSIPQNLKALNLSGNRISADGYRGMVKLLQGGNSTLATLRLNNNDIGDQGVEILVDALQSNKSLDTLELSENRSISNQGQIMLLKLVNNVSTIKATLQSNHKLTDIKLKEDRWTSPDTEIERHIIMATYINSRNQSNPEAAGRKKLIETQLNSAKRAALANLQGVNHSLYSEINPLHLPEVLYLVGRYYDQRELYIALKSSIAGVISIVNRKQCLQHQRAYLRAKLEAVEAEISAIEAAEGHVDVVGIGSESRSSKRRRA